MSTIVIHQPLSNSEFDIADAKAQNTPCGIDGCNGLLHEAAVKPSEWIHEVVAAEFDDGSVKVSLDLNAGDLAGNIYAEFSGVMTAQEFRAMADEYEAFPGWLRSMANQMDAIDGAAPAAREFPRVQAWLNTHDLENAPVGELMSMFTLQEMHALIAHHEARTA